MTGYGKNELSLENKKITVEIKTLNSKQADIHSKFPSLYKEKEIEVRNLVSQKLERGKIEISLYYEVIGEEASGVINQEVFTAYFKQLKKISDKLSLELTDSVIGSIMRMPDTLKIERQELDDKEWKLIRQKVEDTIMKVDEFRSQEGKVLENDLLQRIALIEKYLKEIDQFEKLRIERIRERIKNQLDEIKGKVNFDENRFEQELIFYIEKLDITEEKVRLKNHCEYFVNTCKEKLAIGKKLGFISQEIGREINTIGSKANDSDIQKIVVLMKDELEKIKEQLLNVL